MSEYRRTHAWTHLDRQPAAPYDPVERYDPTRYHPSMEMAYKKGMRERFPENVAPVLPLDQRVMPPTIADEEYRDHRALCRCTACQQPGADEVKREYFLRKAGRQGS